MKHEEHNDDGIPAQLRAAIGRLLADEAVSLPREPLAARPRASRFVRKVNLG